MAFQNAKKKRDDVHEKVIEKGLIDHIRRRFYGG